MPAPKGNKNAAKVNPKKAAFGIRLSPEADKALKIMVDSYGLPRSQVIENLILLEFKRQNAKKREKRFDKN